MFDAAGMIDRARQSTNLTDFGEDTFRKGLEILVKSANADAELNDRGSAIFDDTIVSLLSNRLQIEHWYAKHPEIDEQEIAAPLVGLGLPRTGSTALSCTLAEDPAVRSLRYWEHDSPCPPPELATDDIDPRIMETQERMKTGDTLFPRMKTMVPVSPTAPAECQNLMAYDFKCQQFLCRARVPAYGDWLLNEADLVPTYRYVKRVLKLLQWRRPPNRWRLKNPSHLPFIEAFNQVFPDARFWMTHRPVEDVIPSVVDVYYELLKPMSDTLDADYLLKINLDYWIIGLRRLLDFRDRGNDDRFIDVQFSDFQRDPEGCVEKIYDFVGEDLSDVARERMRTWQTSTPRDKHGLHVMGPVAAALDVGTIREQFRFYRERFQPREEHTTRHAAY